MKLVRFVKEYALWIFIGVVLQALLVPVAFIERGYVAVGGEWLVLPLSVLIGHILMNADFYWD